MLADPELVVVQLVEPLGEFEIALKLERGMLADRMMRREKHAKTETLGHNYSCCCFRICGVLLIRHIVAAVADADGAIVGTGVAMLPALVADAGADGVPWVEVAIGVGTDTVGIGPAELGSAAGLAPSDGTGSDAISAVPAP